MNKNDLVTKIASLVEISKSDATKVLNAFINAITTTLASGGEVRLIGFGSWVVVKKKASDGRNPRTGLPIKIPASNQPKFRAGKELKDAVNKKKKK